MKELLMFILKHSFELKNRKKVYFIIFLLSAGFGSGLGATIVLLSSPEVEAPQPVKEAISTPVNPPLSFDDYFGDLK